MAGTGIAASYGTIKLMQSAGLRPVDWLYGGIRAVEDFSPGQVFRTFQFGNWLSQYTEANSKPFSISPEKVAELERTAWYGDLLKRTDYKASLGLTYGFQFRDNTLYAGDEVILRHARMMTTTGEPHLSTAYARISGTDLPNVHDATKFKIPLGPNGEQIYFTGGNTLWSARLSQVRAIGSEWVHRANRLAAAPFELEPISTIWSKFTKFTQDKFQGWSPTLAVKSGTATQMLGRMAVKWGGVGTAAYLGYQSLDWAVAEADIFNWTPFAEGITAGVATLGVRAHQLAAGLADITPGVRSYQEWQEENAPGSTSLAKLAAFPLVGAVAGATGSWMTTIYTRGKFAAEEMSNGLTFGEALVVADPRVRKYEADLARNNPIATFARNRYGTSKLPFIGELGRTKIYSLGSAVVAGALVLPFLPGALIPEKTYEELDRIYSGEQEIAVRKGRWWELGRCIAPDTNISISHTDTKKAEEITLEDTLVAASGSIHKIKGIYSREYKGILRKIITAFDRNIETGLTENHIVPVLKHKDEGGKWINKEDRDLIELEASKLKVGDYVQIPVPALNTSIEKLETLSLLEEYPVFISGEKIFSAQKNWFSGKLQRSGRYFLPKTIKLDYDLGLLFGYFLAEGNLSYKDDTPAFIETVHSKEELKYARDVVRIAREKFGVEGNIRLKKTGKLTKEGCYVVRLCSSILAKLFKVIFYSDGDKSIPALFLNANLEFKEGLVEGYWRGDGHLDQGRKYLTSARLHLLKNIQQILLSFGIYSSITKERSQKIEEKTFTSYRLGWRETPYQNEQYCLWLNGRLYVQIVSITETEFTGTVYDFEIDHEEHLLQAGTFMVHNSPYEGGKIEYFRPHWYPRMLQDARTASMHGGERPFPLLEWFRQNFTYEPELEHYYDRPYPITGTAFEDIPVAGPLLAATIGRLIKPPKLMHTEEWLGSEGGNLSRSDLARENREFSSQTPVKRIQERYGEIPRHELGEIPKGTPVNPYSNQQLLGEQAYRMTELTGLVGFTLSSIKEKITGTDEWFDQEERLQSARRSYGVERAYWDLEIGGGVGTCFVPGTIIKTKGSKKAIEDINVGDIVLSKGGYRTVKHVLIREPKEKCLRIRTKALRTEFTCTANHWIPILRRKAYSSGHPKPFRENNYEVLEVQARDIMPGDFLFYEIDQLSETVRLEITGGRSVTEEYVYYQASSDFATAWELLENKPNLSRKELRLQGIPDLTAKEALRQFRKNQAPKRIRRYVDIDKDLAYAIGWYLAEGSSDNAKLTYTMHASEIDFANRIANIFETKFEVASSIKVEGNTLKLNIYSVGLAKTFKLFGERAHDKFIPEYLKHLPSEILKELVTGLLLGDGWEKGFTSVSRRLVKDLADCLLKLGYQVSLVLDYEENGCGTYPQGTPRKSCVRNYLRIHEGTRQPWRFFDTAYLVAVENIEEVESPEVVYDLTIEDVHYYTADGIIVHNTEFFRRLYPHHRRQIPEYNPIRNRMPEWLPGPGDKSPDFLHGDPFIKVKEGEMRLPGEGFATRFPELRGVDPADYPLVYRYKILSDIAPYSEKTDILDRQIRAAIARKELTKREIEIFTTAKRQMREAKKSRTNFYDYEVLRDESDLEVPSLGASQSRDLLSLANQHIASKETRPSGFNKVVRGYWETLVSSAQNPFEALTPIAPASKLISMETAIENYKRTQIFGPEIAFWENPIDNFILPFIREAAASAGQERIPASVIRQRQISEYFDILEYIKNKRLAESARNAGWWGTANQYIQLSKETTIGVNPYERDYRTLFRALPKNERNYFNDFVGARTAEERQQILEMVPANMRRIYEAQWELRYSDTIRQLLAKGMIPEELEDRAWQELSATWAKRRSAGFPINEELLAQYHEERKIYEGERYESYANWYRRSVLIPEALQETALPGPDWVGWHPGVDLDDIKLRVVKNEGLDIHDFGLWQSDEREAARRPYVDEAAEELIKTQREAIEKSPEEVKAEIKAILEELGIAGQVNVFATSGGRSRYQFQIEASEDRSEELRQVIKQRFERIG